MSGTGCRGEGKVEVVYGRDRYQRDFFSRRDHLTKNRMVEEEVELRLQKNITG